MKKIKGMTFIEILAVVAIMSILMAIAAPFYANRIENAKVAKAQQDIAVIAQALEMYSMDNGTYPATKDGLSALITAPASNKKTWQGPYLKSLPKDPWAQEYQYKNPGKFAAVDVYSNGSDSKNVINHPNAEA